MSFNQEILLSSISGNLSNAVLVPSRRNRSASGSAPGLSLRTASPSRNRKISTRSPPSISTSPSGSPHSPSRTRFRTLSPPITKYEKNYERPTRQRRLRSQSRLRSKSLSSEGLPSASAPPLYDFTEPPEHIRGRQGYRWSNAQSLLHPNSASRETSTDPSRHYHDPLIGDSGTHSINPLSGLGDTDPDMSNAMNGITLIVTPVNSQRHVSSDQPPPPRARASSLDTTFEGARTSLPPDLGPSTKLPSRSQASRERRALRLKDVNAGLTTRLFGESRCQMCKNGDHGDDSGDDAKWCCVEIMDAVELAGRQEKYKNGAYDKPRCVNCISRSGKCDLVWIWVENQPVAASPHVANFLGESGDLASAREQMP